MADCPKCGAKNPEYAIYCATCSALIETPRKSNGTEECNLRCRRCGGSNPSENFHCGACGTLLDREDDGDEGWTKTYGIPGFYESRVSDGLRGAEVRTKFSLLGFREETRYPRWMITSLIWIYVALSIFLGLLMISTAYRAERLEYVWLGLGVLALSLIVAYVIYRVYYRPPRR